jgi:hypothetical protein
MGIREDYQAVMERQLNEWKALAERFRTDAGQMGTQARAQYERSLDALQTKQGQAWERFHELKAANEGAWMQFKDHMDRAGAEVKSAVEQLTTVFKRDRPQP